ALTIASKMGNAYELVQHERLALKLGFSEDWVREVILLQANAGNLSRQEQLVQALLQAALDPDGHDTLTDFESVIETIGHKRAVAVLMWLGRYVMHALIANCLALKPPVTSPL